MGKKSRAKRDRKEFEAITAGMPELAGQSSPQYDSFGWPAGADGERLARVIAENWLEALDTKGWDQPNSFMQVTRPDTTAADFAAAGMDVGEVGHLLATYDSADFKEVAVAGMVAMKVTTSPAPPVEALWGQTAPPHVNALGVSVEAWVGSERSSLRPSQDPRRTEMRIIQILTRSGLYMQMSRLRDQVDINWSPNAPDRVGVALHQALGVPIPATWPRMSLRRFCGIVAAQSNQEAQRSIRDQAGRKGVTALGSSGFILLMAMRQLWDINRNGAKLSPADAKVIGAALLDQHISWMYDDNARSNLISMVRDGFAALSWKDYLSSPQSRKSLLDDEIVPFQHPLDWASNDTVEAYVGLTELQSAEASMRGLPRAARKSAVEMLHILGLV